MHSQTRNSDASASRRLLGLDAQTRFANLDPVPLGFLREAGQALTSGRIVEAESALGKVFAVAPDHPEALRLKATIHYLRGQIPDAAALLRRVLSMQPDDVLALNHLGAIQLRLGANEEALALLQRACELGPDLGSAWANLASVHQRMNRFEEALAASDQAVRCDPTQVPALIANGHALRGVGRIPAAVAQYRLATTINPDAARAWSALAELKTEPFSDEETEILQRLVDKPGVSDRDRATAGFALGKAREDQQRYADAFDAFNAANAIWHRQFKWDRTAIGALVDRMIQTFATTPAGADDARLGEEIIFVVSLPRSGSTLTEQILSTHSMIEGGGERPDLGAILEQESRRRGVGYPTWIPDATPADWERMGRRYLELTARCRDGRPKSTDKALTTWMHVGAARAMLPGARFVNSRRNPLENAWSIYKHLFATPQPFAYDLDDIAAYWRDYDKLMCFWHARHPEAIRDQVYEELVADPETQIRALIEFCGVPFERACLRFHENKRGVSTASAAQVRQPLRADTARAAHYGDLLAPLRRSLGL